MSSTKKIYRVDIENYKFKDVSTNEEIIQIIVNTCLKKWNSKRKVTVDELPTFEKDNVRYFLFLYNFDEKNSEWSTFLPPELATNSLFDIRNLSLILFIEDGIDIYLAIGGKAFQAVIPFIDHSFGLSIISKILTPDKDSIVSISSRSITGVRSGISEQYSQEFLISDFAKFGKVPTEIHLILSESMSSEHFSFFQSKPMERVKIYAGKSFKVKKHMNFEELHLLIGELGYMREKIANQYLSTYIEIKNSQRIQQDFKPLLIRALYDELEFYRRSPTSKDRRFKFDLSCPGKLVEFYGADFYILKEKVDEEGRRYEEFARTENREDIYNLAMKRAYEVAGDNNFYEFRKFINGVRLLSYSDSVSKSSSSASFIFHFTTEFETDECKSIFLVDNKWYVLNNSFIEDLKFECVQCIRNHRLEVDIFNLVWPVLIKGELEYNSLYLHHEANYYLFDTLTPQGIELCDVLYTNSDTTYLIHMKNGFDNSIRELSNQILLSARRLNEDIKSGSFDYLDKIYERGIKCNQIASKNYNKDLFRSWFKKKIVFVFAFSSKLYHDDLVEESIDKYTSNIARYSVVQCTREMIAYNYELRIRQVRKESDHHQD